MGIEWSTGSYRKAWIRGFATSNPGILRYWRRKTESQIDLIEPLSGVEMRTGHTRGVAWQSQVEATPKMIRQIMMSSSVVKPVLGVVAKSQRAAYGRSCILDTDKASSR